MFHPNADPSHSESGYNSLLPHPTLRAVVAAISNQQFQFVPGEEQLVAMSVQLKRRLPMFSEREAYNADGVVRLTIDKGFTTELLVLETSRAYNKAEKTKSAYDHHKAMFALLAMVKALADKYPMAYFENIAAIKVFFLHVYDDKMRLWSMSTPRKDVYIMRREFSVHVPICIEERDPHVVKYLKAFWSLKDLLKKSGESIMKMQQAHKHAARIYRYKKYPRDLLSDIVNPAIVKLTESKNSKGMHDQLPNSSLAGSGTCSFELRQ
ncbi:hypothetical protein BJV82DRAFT_514846 [Fennellomyces sp. T-0311]|nr:hypothetical protein BJV82DRAFT_514846 [Fennellomyces sp. T-0311]